MNLFNIVVTWIISKVLDLILLILTKRARKKKEEYKDYFEDRRRYRL